MPNLMLQKKFWKEIAQHTVYQSFKQNYHKTYYTAQIRLFLFTLVLCK
jgi:hypothetical protein